MSNPPRYTFYSKSQSQMADPDYDRRLQDRIHSERMKMIAEAKAKKEAEAKKAEVEAQKEKERNENG